MADTEEHLKQIEVSCGKQDLASTGFTKDAEDLVTSATQEVFSAIVQKSVAYADADKQLNFGREVTTQHVQLALNRLTGPLQRSDRPTWSVLTNILEYVFTIGAGAGIGNLDRSWGAGLAVVCGLLAIALMSFRHIYVERDR